MTAFFHLVKIGRKERILALVHAGFDGLVRKAG
jgi:hypothetical protein